MSVTEVFRRITSILAQAGIPYMPTGSFAAVYYGAPRSTQDIDFVIPATTEQLRTFDRLLPKNEYYLDMQAALEAQKRESLFNVIDKASGWKIDFIIRSHGSSANKNFDGARRSISTASCCSWQARHRRSGSRLRLFSSTRRCVPGNLFL